MKPACAGFWLGISVALVLTVQTPRLDALAHAYACPDAFPFLKISHFGALKRTMLTYSQT